MRKHRAVLVNTSFPAMCGVYNLCMLGGNFNKHQCHLAAQESFHMLGHYCSISLSGHSLKPSYPRTPNHRTINKFARCTASFSLQLIEFYPTLRMKQAEASQLTSHSLA